MAFWSSDKIKTRQALDPLITDFNPDRVKQGAYELSMGAQAAVSRSGWNKVIKLKLRETLYIPPGQFALLLSEEVVCIPADVVSFISLKTSVKSQGLVNVSGFHVDPGFRCRLKFWVYNAGNDDIPIQRGDPVFLIWFSDLDAPTSDPYDKNSAAHNEITSADLRQLRGHLASPAALAKQIRKLEHKIDAFAWIGGTAVVILSSLCIALASPLLDYIIKPVVQKFSADYPATTGTNSGASTSVTSSPTPRVIHPPPALPVDSAASSSPSGTVPDQGGLQHQSP